MILTHFTDNIGAFYKLHQKENVIVKAAFDARIINLSEFEEFISPVYGNCFAFNAKNMWGSRNAHSSYGR